MDLEALPVTFLDLAATLCTFLSLQLYYLFRKIDLKPSQTPRGLKNLKKSLSNEPNTTYAILGSSDVRLS